MKTHLIILGCGNSLGVPDIRGKWGKSQKNNKKNHRTRCSAIIKKGSNHILIDTSPDIKIQFLNNNIKKLDAVLYTHEHADQTNGLFELRPFFWNNKKRINIYGNSNTMSLLKKRFKFCFKKESYYPAIVKANIVKSKFSIGSSNKKIFFKTFPVQHGRVKAVAYVFEKTAYLSDCNDISIIKNTDLKNLNYLIIDCLKIKDNYAHFKLSETLYIHKHLKPKQTILTNLHSDLDYNFLKQKLPKNIIPAYDGLKLNL
tara:strand:- start:16 stop:786 length:771 start_codon:yes stop_codon:yes gene_type:complete